MIRVTAVREALNEVLARIDDNLTVYQRPPHHPDHLPAAIVYPPDTIDYRVARHTDRAVFPILVLVGPQDPTGVEVLEGLMSGEGPLSVIAALYVDRTLAGAVSSLRLLDMSSGAYQIGTGPDDNAIGAEFRVEVLA